jgi:hypothetical protein
MSTRMLCCSFATSAIVAATPLPADVATDAQRLMQFTEQQVVLPQGLPPELVIDIKLDGVPHTLHLHAQSLRAASFQLRVQGAGGLIETVESPPPCTYRGEVVGERGGRAAASIMGGSLVAMIRADDGTVWGVQPMHVVDADAPPTAHLVYRTDDVVPAGGTCGVADLPHDAAPPAAVPVAGASLRVAEIAFDADYAFFAANDSDVAAVATDIEAILNSVEAIYEGDVGITYSLTAILVRTNPLADPYTATAPDALLSQFRIEWISNQAAIVRDTAHLMTGKEIDGSVIGIAFGIGAICNAGSYALSQSHWTNFYPERVAVTAHELGHLWGAHHCDAVSDCQIMCSGAGGCTGLINGFGASEAGEIVAYRDTLACLGALRTFTPHLVWRDPGSGHNQVWVVGREGVGTTGALPTVRGKSWSIAGSGDFDSDGFSDIVWRNKVSGKNTIWTLGGLSVIDTGGLPKETNANWRIVGTGDFDGDGATDILWRHSASGENRLWFVNGVSLSAQGNLPSQSKSFAVAATGDFDGDTRADILWRNLTTGANLAWLVDGTSFLDSASLPSLTAGWSAKGSGDFDGDGKSDVLWRHKNSGKNLIWFMDGASVASSAMLAVRDSNWNVVGVSDIDLDGKADILWRNNLSGDNQAWFMDGVTVSDTVALATVPGSGWAVSLGTAP